jgi:glutaredoxin
MPRRITVVSKRGCHICDDVLAAVRGTCPASEVEVEYIDEDPALHDEYWLTVPVVIVDGKVVFDANEMGRGRGYLKRLESLIKLA